MDLVELEPMDRTAYEIWRADSIADYADEKVRAGNWPAINALERAEAEHRELLPDGLETPGHHLFVLRHATRGPIGYAWFRIAPRHAVAGAAFEAYLYDLVIEPNHRGQALGRPAIAAIEAKARELGASRMALHVFGHNTVARHLYDAAGFSITNLSMSKALD